jgi:hypothetical protein
VNCVCDAGTAVSGCQENGCAAFADGCDGLDPPPPVFFRKNVKVKELCDEMRQGCDSMGFSVASGCCKGVARFRNGIEREGLTLYTNQYS